MQRYFLSDDVALDAGRVAIVLEDYHHIVHVMRMSLGEKVQIGYKGEVYLGFIVDITEHQVVVELLEVLPASDTFYQLTLYQGLPKGEKIDLIIRQACEIGVTKIIVYSADHSVAKISSDKREARLLRWRKIAKEAAEQAKRMRIPDVFFATSIVQALDIDPPTALLIPYERQDGQMPSIKTVLRTIVDASEDQLLSQDVSIGFVIGPEGGFSVGEVSWLTEQKGGQVLTLGPRILRTETAAVVTAAIVLYELDHMEVK